MNRTRFMNMLKRRFSLRLHMTLILLATGMAGILADKGMWHAGLRNVALRYPITVMLAYLVFFIAIKIWLHIMTDTPASSASDTGDGILDCVDIPIPSGGGGGPAFVGGGGGFDGGGASDGFGDAAGGIASSTSDSLDGVGETVGGAVGAVADDEGGLALVIVAGVLLFLLFAVLGAGVFLIWQAPAILAEAAFNTVLAASLVRSTRRMNEPDWIGSVFAATWKPFAVVLAMAIVSGWAMHHYLPKASRIMDVVRMVW